MSIAEGNGLDFSARLNDAQANIADGQNIGATPMVQPNPQNMKPIEIKKNSLGDTRTATIVPTFEEFIKLVGYFLNDMA